MYVIAANAAPGSPLARELDPALSWTQTDYWLQSIEYSLRWLVWSKTKDGRKNHRRPKPVEAPGKRKRRRKGGPRMTKQALREYLARPRTAIDGSKPKVHRLPEKTADDTGTTTDRG